MSGTDPHVNPDEQARVPAQPPDTLEALFRQVHQDILQRASSTETARPSPDPHRPVELFDTETATLSRHLAVVEMQLYPVAGQRLTEGHDLVAAQLRDAREMERLMRRIVGRLYGDYDSMPTSLPTLQRDLRVLFDEHVRAEEEMARQLDATLSDDERRRLVRALIAAVRFAPTRAHPYVPHSRGLRRLAYWITSSVDHALDVMDNRILPERMPRMRRSLRPTLWGDYLLGTPSFEVGPEREPPKPAQPRPPRPPQPSPESSGWAPN